MNILKRLMFIHLICLLISHLPLQAKNVKEIQILTPQTRLAAYQLPNTHPAQETLKTLFHNPRMFDSSKNLKKEGFTVKLGHKSLLVGFHPTLNDFIIKKFSNNVHSKLQLDNYVQRIKGAEILEKYIQEHHFKHLVIPKKWLYRLPKNFSKDGMAGYVLVVEKMDIYDDWDNPNGEIRRLYYNMDREMVTELCMILHDVGGCDAFLRNQPFTRSGKIAFVDTEHVGVMKFHQYFLKNLVPYFNEEMQAYAIDLWAELEKQKDFR